MWIKIGLLISVIGLGCVVGLTFTKYLNVQQIENTGDADSYHDLSALIYVAIGILMVISGLLTYKLTHHIGAIIIPVGLGITLLMYGLYICSVKGMII